LLSPPVLTVSFHDGDEETISKEEIPTPDLRIERALHKPLSKGSSLEMINARTTDLASSLQGRGSAGPAGAGSGARRQAWEVVDGSLSTTSPSPSGPKKRKNPEELKESLLVLPFLLFFRESTFGW